MLGVQCYAGVFWWMSKTMLLVMNPNTTVCNGTFLNLLMEFCHVKLLIVIMF